MIDLTKKSTQKTKKYKRLEINRTFQSSNNSQTIKTYEQKKEITRLSDLVEVLNNNIKTLKEKLNKEIEYWKNLFNKLANAIDKVLGREPKEYADDYEDLADAINNDYYDYDKDNMDKDDFDIGF